MKIKICFLVLNLIAVQFSFGQGLQNGKERWNLLREQFSATSTRVPVIEDLKRGYVWDHYAIAIKGNDHYVPSSPTESWLRHFTFTVNGNPTLDNSYSGYVNLVWPNDLSVLVAPEYKLTSDKMENSFQTTISSVRVMADGNLIIETSRKPYFVGMMIELLTKPWRHKYMTRNYPNEYAFANSDNLVLAYAVFHSPVNLDAHLNRSK